MKFGRFIPLAIAAAALALGAYGLMRGKREASDAMIGKVPDPLSLAELTPEGAGTARPLDLKGPLIVNFWASWCTPCRVEHPLVMQLARDAGAPIAGIAYRDAPDAASGYLRQLGNPYADVRLDPEGQAGFNFGIKGVPETFVIGADGVILARVSGPLTPDIIKGVVVPALQRARTTPSQ